MKEGNEIPVVFKRLKALYKRFETSETQHTQKKPLYKRFETSETQHTHKKTPTFL